jgi:hypothetical protein
MGTGVLEDRLEGNPGVPMNDKEVRKHLSKEEQELFKEALYQGGGAMMCDGDVMERLLRELAEFRSKKPQREEA